VTVLVVGTLGAAGAPAADQPPRNERPDVGRLGSGISGIDPGAVTPGGSGTLAAYPGGQNIAQDVPAMEIGLGDLFAPVPSGDYAALGFGRSDGQAVALVLEDFQLQSLYSSDGGVIFGTEVRAAGRPGGPSVLGGLAATLAPDDTLYAAYRMADPMGDVGLQLVRSNDMGRTWDSPVDLVSSGDASHGVGSPGIAANASGVVAVVYRRSWGGDPYVRVSTDRGVTWAGAVRLDPGAAEGSGPIADRPAVDVDPAGNVHVVYAQDRGAGYQIYYTRSTNGGVSFEGERSLTSLLPPGETANSYSPVVAVAGDGSIVVAHYDTFGTDRLYVLRSADAGVSFTRTLARDLGSPIFRSRPHLAVDPATSTLLVGLIEVRNDHMETVSGSLTVQRSADNGQTFGSPQTLATRAVDLSPGGSIWFTRTADGNWGAGWIDNRDDTYIYWLTDIYVSVSTDDGVSWGASHRVDGGTAASAASNLGALTSVNSDELLVVYLDDRAERRSHDVYSNRSAADPVDFSANEQRIDTDRGTRTPSMAYSSTLASDGGSHVYVTLQVFDPGPYGDIWLAISSDGGYTFPDVRRVDTEPAGQEISWVPQVAATPDGHVFVAYKAMDRATGDWKLKLNSSSDFGNTWSSTATVLGDLVEGVSVNPNNPEFHVIAVNGGRAYVAWSDGTDVWLYRTTDGGATYTINDIDDDSRSFRTNGHPSLCAQGTPGQEAVFLAFQSRTDAGQQVPSIWARVSDAGGATWGSRVHLRGGSLAGFYRAVTPHVACGSSGDAVAVWSDARGQVSGMYQVYASRYDGSSWSPEVAIGAAPTVHEYYPEVEFASATDVIVAATGWPTTVFTSHSADGGQTFGPKQRHDASGVNPDADSIGATLAADGQGNVWFSWIESTAGEPAIAVRHSADSGVTFGPVWRLNRETPQGCVLNSYWAGWSYSLAHPDKAFFSWGGLRQTHSIEAMVSAYDLDDFDRDQSPATADCNDSDPGAFTLPATVSGVGLEKVTGANRISWTSQAGTAGASTAYDVATGVLGDLVASGGFSAATCLVDDHPTPTYDDVRADPSPGTGYYYLIRAQNSCGPGSFGDSTQSPDPRDDLDASPPCP
jgi:hypothetical protein